MNYVQIHVRVPEHVKEWLQDAATAHKRSLNEEILFRLDHTRHQDAERAQWLERQFARAHRQVGSDGVGFPGELVPNSCGDAAPNWGPPSYSDEDSSYGGEPLTAERLKANIQAAIDASVSRQEQGLEPAADWRVTPETWEKLDRAIEALSGSVGRRS